LAPDPNIPMTRAWELVNKLSDEELAAEVLHGAHDALTVLFDRYHKLVFAVAYKILHSPAEAEELVQAVFLEAFRALANFDPARGTFKVWLSQFAYTRSINQRRHLNVRRFYDLVSLTDATPDVLSPNAVDPDAVRLAEQLLESLSDLRRTVVELTYFEGLTAKEIADRIGISPDNVRHELYRGLKKLRTAAKSPKNFAAAALASDEHEREERMTPNAQPL